jgi:hypothetical protein
MKKEIQSVRTYYLIQPGQKLLEQLRLGPSDASSILGSPVLWERNEIAGKWSFASLATQVKVLFLLDLKQSYLDYPQDSEFKRFLGELLGLPPFSISVFDEWWKLERYDPEAIFEEVENALDIATLQLISPTGDSLVDAWLEHLIVLRKG